MRVFAGYLVLSTMVLLVGACGGSSTTNGDCAKLACLQTGVDLMMGCAAEAPCVLQQDANATGSSAMCFNNGVKIQASVQTGTSAAGSAITYTYKVKKRDALCYTRTLVSIQAHGDGGFAYWMDSTLTDGTGTTVVTARIDQNDVITVTCPGKEATVYSGSCGSPDTAAKAAYVTLGSTPPTCTDGTCSF